MAIVDKVIDPEAESVTLYTGTTKRCEESSGKEACYHVDGEKIVLGRLHPSIKPHAVYLSCGDIAMESVLLEEMRGPRLRR